jgi:hypothetical protein
MTVARVTQSTLETLVQAIPKARVTAAMLETLVQSGAVKARLTQATVEVLRDNLPESGASTTQPLLIIIA